MLPVGLKDEIGAETVKIFCPKCQCVYHPPMVRHRSHHGSAGNGGVDGVSFGTTFPHLFLMTFSNLVPDPLPANSSYIPRVFGFRVHSSAHQRNVPSPAPQPAGSGTRRTSKTQKAADAPGSASEPRQVPDDTTGTGKQSGKIPSVDEANMKNQSKRKGDNGSADGSAKRIKR